MSEETFNKLSKAIAELEKESLVKDEKIAVLEKVLEEERDFRKQDVIFYKEIIAEERLKYDNVINKYTELVKLQDKSSINKEQLLVLGVILAFLK